MVLFVVGLAEGVVDAGTNTLIVWVHGHAVGPFMNLLHFFFGIGALTSPIIVAQVIGLSGTIDWAYRTLALFFIVPVLWLVGLPSPAPHKEAAVGSARHANPWLVALIAVFFFLYVGAEVGYGGWVYTYATRLGLSSQTTGAYLTSLFWGALTAGRLLSVPVAARLPPQTILFGDLAGCFASVALLLAFPSSTWIIWVATFLIGLSMASIFPTTLVLAGQKMTLTGKTTGWFFFGAGAGGMILPWIIGQLFEPIGPQVTIWLILFDLLLATIAYGLLMWRSRSLVVAPASD